MPVYTSAIEEGTLQQNSAIHHVTAIWHIINLHSVGSSALKSLELSNW